MIGRIIKHLKAFRRNEDGNATLDFIMVLPAFMILFTSAYEGGVLSTRHVMLERGVDVAVRDVRIGALINPTHDQLSERICEAASIIPDCMANLRLEMVATSLRDFQPPGDDVACVDRADTGTPVLNFNTGLNNQMMILRACALFDPMIPTTGLGKEIPKRSGGAYALQATSAYVMEPFQS